MRYRGAMPVLPARDELLTGPKKSYSVYLPEKLVAELDRSAAIDGVTARGEYLALLATAALRIRERERLDEAITKRR